MSYVHNLVHNNPVQNNLVQTRGVDSEKMFSNKLQELEKQLLNDNDEDDECDADDSIGLKIEKLVASLPEGGFLLLPEHAKKLAALADLYKELDYLVGAVSSPKKPFASIVGGSKVSSKIGMIDSSAFSLCMFG
ncbi:hypothetical protein ACFX15_013789 [Malus domestica]